MAELDIAETKHCPKCRQTKPIDEFGPRGASRPGERRSYCRPCVVADSKKYRTTEQGRAAKKRERAKWRAKYPERNREHKRQWRLRSDYGISTAEFEAMKAEQNDACAICAMVPSETLSVDHCHSTGAIRGLLCRRCNAALGLFRDSPANAEAAAAAGSPFASGTAPNRSSGDQPRLSA